MCSWQLLITQNHTFITVYSDNVGACSVCQCCCQGLETQGRGQGRGLENWSSRILKDKDFPRGQQHWKHLVSNKRPGLLEIQRCQSNSHTLVTSYLLQHLPQHKVLTQIAYSVLENFRGLELPRTRTRTRTRTWKLILQDPRGQGLSSRTTTLVYASFGIVFFIISLFCVIAVCNFSCVLRFVMLAV